MSKEVKETKKTTTKKATGKKATKVKPANKRWFCSFPKHCANGFEFREYVDAPDKEQAVKIFLENHISHALGRASMFLSLPTIRKEIVELVVVVDIETMLAEQKKELDSIQDQLVDFMRDLGSHTLAEFHDLHQRFAALYRLEDRRASSDLSDEFEYVASLFEPVYSYMRKC